MKKLLAMSLLAFLGLATHAAAAQGFVPLAPIPGLTEGVTANTPGLATFFNNLYKYLIGFAAILAFIEIVWGGLEYSTQDSVSQKSDGKQRIYNAIGGLILVLSPVLVFSIINPSILNLSLKLPELKTATGNSVGGGGGGAGNATTTVASGCIESGTSGLLLVASCNSLKEAQDWTASCSGSTNVGGTLFFSSTPTVKTNPTSGIKTYISVCSTTKVCLHRHKEHIFLRYQPVPALG